jgi:hypothetical protein
MPTRKAGSALVYATASIVTAAAERGLSAGDLAASAQVSRAITHSAARYGHAETTSPRTSGATRVA